MDWDSLRQGASYGVLDGLVKAAAGVVVTVVIARATLRWLRFPDRFIDDDNGTPLDAGAVDDATDGETPERHDRIDALGEDDR